MLPEGIIIVLGFLLLFVKMATTAAKTRRVYLVDFACYKPPESQSCTWAFVAQQFCSMGKLSERNLDFMQKTMERSGMGDSSYLSEGLIKKPVQISLEDALSETRAAMFGAVRDLLEKTGLSGSDIGILVVNCTVFCMNPSLSAMIVHEFKLRDNVICYSLQGMGCSAGLVAIGLAKRLLQVHNDSYALVVSTECITDGMYRGDDRSMILINCFFRVGGAAILLSNQSFHRSTAKYELCHTVQNQTAGSERSYNCIFRKEDDEGEEGISVSKDLLDVACNTIEINIAILGHLILPTSEKFKYS